MLEREVLHQASKRRGSKGEIGKIRVRKKWGCRQGEDEMIRDGRRVIQVYWYPLKN